MSRPERTTTVTDSTRSTHAASRFYSSFGGMVLHGAENTILPWTQTAVSHSTIVAFQSCFVFYNLINLKLWKRKLQVVKQITNSIYCIYGFYSRTMKYKNIYFFNIPLTSLQEEIYLGKVAVNSKEASMNSSFFPTSGRFICWEVLWVLLRKILRGKLNKSFN